MVLLYSKVVLMFQNLKFCGDLLHLIFLLFQFLLLIVQIHYDLLIILLVLLLLFLLILVLLILNNLIHIVFLYLSFLILLLLFPIHFFYLIFLQPLLNILYLCLDFYVQILKLLFPFLLPLSFIDSFILYAIIYLVIRKRATTNVVCRLNKKHIKPSNCQMCFFWLFYFCLLIITEANHICLYLFFYVKYYTTFLCKKQVNI